MYSKIKSLRILTDDSSKSAIRISESNDEDKCLSEVNLTYKVKPSHFFTKTLRSSDFFKSSFYANKSCDACITWSDQSDQMLIFLIELKSSRKAALKSDTAKQVISTENFLNYYFSLLKIESKIQNIVYKRIIFYRSTMPLQKMKSSSLTAEKKKHFDLDFYVFAVPNKYYISRENILEKCI